MLKKSAPIDLVDQGFQPTAQHASLFSLHATVLDEPV
jgi:hypothetical protein